MGFNDSPISPSEATQHGRRNFFANDIHQDADKIRISMHVRHPPDKQRGRCCTLTHQTILG